MWYYFTHSSNRTHIAFQYERFFRPEATLVASVFAPIMFPPAPVLVYKEKKDNSQVTFSPVSLRFLCHLCVSTVKKLIDFHKMYLNVLSFEVTPNSSVS